VAAEVPRRVVDVVEDPEWFRRGSNSLLRQLALLIGQGAAERTAESVGAEIVLCDRTMLDHWAYTCLLFGSELDGSESAVLSAFVEEYMQSYSALFFLSPEFPPDDDGTREDDVTFRDEVDAMMRELMGRYHLEADVLQGSVSARVQVGEGLVAALLARSDS
jgi:hypothetical protein